MNETICELLRGLGDIERHLNTILLRPTCSTALRNVYIIRKALQISKDLTFCTKGLLNSKNSYIRDIFTGISGVDSSLLSLLETTIITDPPSCLSCGGFVLEEYGLNFIEF